MADVTKRWERRSEDRPDELIAAAIERFAEKGYAGTKTEEIARKAGVTIGTLYRYFPTKEALFEAAVQQAMAGPIAVAGARAAAYQGSKVEHLKVFLRNWWALSNDPDYARVLKLVIAESANFPGIARMVVEQVVQPGQSMCARLLREGIEKGEFRDIDVDPAVRVFSGAISFAAIYQHSLGPHDRRGFDPEAYIDTAVSLFLDGLLAGKAGSSRTAGRRRPRKR